MFVVEVPSEFTEGRKYTVRKAGNVWVCSCKDHVHRSNGEAYTCKHIAEVARSLFLHITASATSKAAKGLLVPVASE